jgi:hypothetical protein
MSGLGYNTTYLDIEAAKEKQKLDQDEKGYQLVSNVSPDGILTYGSEEEIGVLDAWKQNRLYIGPSGPSTTPTYQLVSNVSPHRPGALLIYGRAIIGLQDAWSQNRLYIGPRGPGDTHTSSRFGSWFRNKFSRGPYPSPPITTSPPRCSNCEGRGCMYCQKGGKTRRRRLSTRRRRLSTRRRRLSTRRRRSN